MHPSIIFSSCYSGTDHPRPGGQNTCFYRDVKTRSFGSESEVYPLSREVHISKRKGKKKGYVEVCNLVEKLFWSNAVVLKAWV